MSRPYGKPRSCAPANRPRGRTGAERAKHPIAALDRARQVQRGRHREAGDKHRHQPGDTPVLRKDRRCPWHALITPGGVAAPSAARRLPGYIMRTICCRCGYRAGSIEVACLAGQYAPDKVATLLAELAEVTGLPRVRSDEMLLFRTDRGDSIS